MSRARVLRDSHIVVLASASVVGAVWAQPFGTTTRVAALAAAVAGLACRRPLPLVAGTLLTLSALAAASWAGLRAPPAAPVDRAWALLITDPAPFAFGTIGAEVRLDRRHVQIWARGEPASALDGRLAGDSVRLSGALRPLTAQAAKRAAPRHVSARLNVDEVSGVRVARGVGGVANSYRRLVARGAVAIPERLRPLFGGMVMGDDRGQRPEMADAFRAAGLTHLLAVSGQNVAFVLLLSVPLMRRGGLRWRLALTIAVLIAFGVLTRWEPSVLRAVAMAGVTAFGAFAGRPVRGVRLLCLAVTACVLVDPLLVHSVGFRLSVAACTGLVVLTPALARRVPLLVAASIAAQAGAAIVLVPTFGNVPLVALPANVLAVPAAGPIMMWGLVAGPIAGLFPSLAPVLHAPTRAGLTWVASVAEHAARIPLAPLGAAAAAVCVLSCVALARSRSVLPRAAAAVTLLVVVASAARPPSPTSGGRIGDGVALWVAGDKRVLVVGHGSPTATLTELRARRVHRVDVLVTTHGGRAAADVAWPLVHALRPQLVLAPAHHQLAPARTATLGTVAHAGTLQVEVVSVGPPLRVTVRRVAGSGTIAAKRPTGAALAEG